MRRWLKLIAPLSITLYDDRGRSRNLDGSDDNKRAGSNFIIKYDRGLDHCIICGSVEMNNNSASKLNPEKDKIHLRSFTSRDDQYVLRYQQLFLSYLANQKDNNRYVKKHHLIIVII